MDKPKYILFDFDDVINIYNRRYDSDKIDQATWIRLLKKRKKDKITIQQVCRLEGLHLKDVVEFYHKCALPNYSLIETIKDIEFSNKYTLGIFSNNSSTVIMSWLTNYGLKKYFEVILTPENLDWNWKPSDTTFYKVIDVLNCLPSDIIFFDDDIKNIVVATRIGFNAKHYTKKTKINI